MIASYKNGFGIQEEINSTMNDTMTQIKVDVSY